MTAEKDLRLVVRRLIDATPERLFKAWTSPSELLSWWGPRAMRCTCAEIDLRVGGRYRICNSTADGKTVVITGRFELVRPPSKLVYDWSIESENIFSERVTVLFKSHKAGTEVVVTHERIATERLKEGHARGWDGCLDGLVAHVEQLNAAL